MNDRDPIAREVVVHGRVQGVFFRASCHSEALQRGVAGWARNEPDGTVHALFEGTPEAVDEMVAWTRVGPKHARVESVEVVERTPTGAHGFDIG